MASDAINATKFCVASAERSVASASQALKAADAQVRMAEEMLASSKAQRERARSRVASSEKELREAKENLKRVEERFPVIHLDLDSSEPEGEGENGGGQGDKVGKRRAFDDVANSRARKSRRVGNNKANKGQNRSSRDVRMDAVRIAVGKKVFNRNCNLRFQFGTEDPYILFTYDDYHGKRNEHCDVSYPCKELPWTLLVGPNNDVYARLLPAWFGTKRT